MISLAVHPEDGYEQEAQKEDPDNQEPPAEDINEDQEESHAFLSVLHQSGANDNAADESQERGDKADGRQLLRPPGRTPLAG